MTRYISISGQEVPYDVLINDIASKVVELISHDKNDPDFISQRTAFKLFGRRNVERWREQGKIAPYRRPGRVEYRTAELRLLQRTQENLPPNGSNP